MKNEGIKVSIIVPVYNGEATIERCIDSILRQSLAEIEVIVVDDGSTDKTGEICKAYSDKRLVYHHKENGGVSTARNKGIAMAKGEYIGFVDADDYIVPEMCEKMYSVSVKTNSDICICDYNIIFDNGERKAYSDLLRGGYFDKSQIRKEVLTKFLGHIDDDGNISKYDWAVIRRFFKKDFLAQIQVLFDENLSNSEDCLFSYIATNQANGMFYLKDENLYINMRNAHSMTRRYLNDYWEQRCRLIDMLEEIISNDCAVWSTKAFPLFVMRCVRPGFTNIAYGFGQVNIIKSIKDFAVIVHDPRVRKMCEVMNVDKLNEEWKKLFVWCKKKSYFTLFFYYMDVCQGNKICHYIRRVQKGIDRRICKVKRK